MALNSAQRDVLAYYQTLEEPDENGHYSREFALAVRRIVDALDFCWIYDVTDEPVQRTQELMSKTESWDSDDEIFTANEVEAVLTALGIEMVDETQNDFLSFCPYHGNTHDPAFSTSKRYGYSVCFNPACAKGSDRRLTLDGLVREMKALNHFESKRFIKSAIARAGAGSFEDKFAALS